MLLVVVVCCLFSLFAVCRARCVFACCLVFVVCCILLCCDVLLFARWLWLDSGCLCVVSCCCLLFGGCSVFVFCVVVWWGVFGWLVVVVCRSLHLLFVVVCCLLFVDCCSLIVVRCSVFVFRLSVYLQVCMLFGVLVRTLFVLVVHRSLFVVGCLL